MEFLQNNKRMTYRVVDDISWLISNSMGCVKDLAKCSTFIGQAVYEEALKTWPVSLSRELFLFLQCMGFLDLQAFDMNKMYGNMLYWEGGKYTSLS